MQEKISAPRRSISLLAWTLVSQRQPRPQAKLWRHTPPSDVAHRRSAILIADGKVKPIAEPASAGTAVLTGLYGITADSADANKEVPVYLTGEFFADGLVLPNNVSVDDVEVPLRNLGIFLK